MNKEEIKIEIRDKNRGEKKHNVFLYVMLGSCLVAILTSFYFFYFKKDYDFFIETSCDPKTETCFFRDCENAPDECPPNNLSYYNQYTIKAADFKYCANEDCTTACATNLINCEKTECTESDVADGVCLVPVSEAETQN